MSEDRWYVVVFDDRREFALHVWRYLNRSLGIGSGSADWMPERTLLPFLDGVHRFYWLQSDDKWKENLELFLTELVQGWHLLAIVDVVGKEGYDPNRVLSCLVEWGKSNSVRIEPWLISAYQIGARIEQGVPIRSKSRSTLNEIARLLYAGDHAKPKGVPGAKHILVTGAGFEIKNRWGGFGMLPTPTLLERMGDPFLLLNAGDSVDENKKGITYLQPDSDGFPRPTGARWELVKSIQRAAAERELDRYWDILLGKELAHNLGEVLEMDKPERQQVTARALLAERRMREAFRRSVREHDWGHMNQSLAAAELPWHAWLTTNYTRFADRAIALGAPLLWRIITTAAEAGTSIREDNWLLEGRKGEELPRYLFKLHGDVGHLHTMAIAGHDKDPFSPLSVPVEDLHQIYASAERFLGFSLRSFEVPVVWHIVGHALADRGLVNLIRRACEQIRGEHLFLIADPSPALPRKNLERDLPAVLGPRGIRFEIRDRAFFAEEYMARLARQGLPCSAALESVIEWFETLPRADLTQAPRSSN
ncbi:MAG TPA: hypothetical protein VGX68_07330 [Thermoanaerobaculia bacterium]|jgi:hypothetical protein|nr:hypothetical protein [Thermoanaerobaculia bacterium]